MGYEKDVFAVLGEGVELSRFTRQFKNKYGFFYYSLGIQDIYVWTRGFRFKAFWFSISVLHFFDFSVQFEFRNR